MDPVVFLLRMRAPCWWQPGVVAHELGHVIGFFHQQSRPDRDEYIRIHYENIANHLKDSFTKLSWDRIADLGVPYDYLSIMHYGSRVRPSVQHELFPVSVSHPSVHFVHLMIVNNSVTCRFAILFRRLSRIMEGSL